MNLIKVDRIIYNSDADYETDNCTWYTSGYEKFENIVSMGITINHIHCIEYIDGLMYINVDKLNSVKLENFGNIINIKHITLIALNNENIIYFGEEEIIRKYTEAESFVSNTCKLTYEEYLIKNILE